MRIGTVIIRQYDSKSPKSFECAARFRGRARGSAPRTRIPRNTLNMRTCVIKKIICGFWNFEDHRAHTYIYAMCKMACACVARTGVQVFARRDRAPRPTAA